VALLNFALRARRRIVVWIFAFGLLGLALAFLRPRTWTSEASFQPQSASIGGNLGQLAGLAAQFGVQLPQNEQSQSPDFYVALLKSSELLVSAGRSRFGAASEEKQLAEYYDLVAETPGLVDEKVVKRLSKDVNARTDIKTGVISLSVRAPSAELAQALAARLLNLLNDYNLQTRQSQARAERAFAEQRLAEVRDSLRATEDRLQSFLQRNRDFRNSPELAFQQERLAREVAMQSQLSGTLATAYEQAKLAEVRDIPVLTVVQRPSLPARPDSRALVRRLMLGMFLGALFALVLAVLSEIRTAVATAKGAEYEELRALAAAARADGSRIFGRSSGRDGGA
jgi:uncharacterized protein involved in exopolysaccharide biosynthesis